MVHCQHYFALDLLAGGPCPPPPARQRRHGGKGLEIPQDQGGGKPTTFRHAPSSFRQARALHHLVGNSEQHARKRKHHEVKHSLPRRETKPSIRREPARSSSTPGRSRPGLVPALPPGGPRPAGPAGRPAVGRQSTGPGGGGTRPPATAGRGRGRGNRRGIVDVRVITNSRGVTHIQGVTTSAHAAWPLEPAGPGRRRAGVLRRGLWGRKP